MKAEKEIQNFAVKPCDETLRQFEECYSQDFVVKAALMPDAHKGYAAPIGAVLVTKDAVVPAWVGFDIGCGMTSAHIKGIDLVKKVKENLDLIFDKVKEQIPMGMGEIQKHKDNLTEETYKEFKDLVRKFAKGAHHKQILDFIMNAAARHIGSLGDGNHFVEMGVDEENELWVTVHSGSRGIGYKVAEKYMKKSAGKDANYESTHPLDVNSELGQEYLNVLDFGLDFALLNRKELIKKTVIGLSKALGEELEFEIWVNKNHNHAIKNSEGLYVHRKGATPAEKDERGVIPANMKDGCFLVEGLGNADFMHSSSHGAGRVLGRRDATKKLSMEEFKKSMEGIKGTVSEGTLDEAPMAYKNIYEVMEAQKESVKVIKHLKPLINWKGERGMWKKNKEAKKNQNKK